MTDMPTTYDTHQTTTTTTAQGPINIAPRMEYLRTVPGILKIVEIILDLIVFICACIIWWGGPAIDWIRFVSMSAFLTTLVYFIIYFINAAPHIYRSMNDNVNLFQLIAVDFLVLICNWILYWPGGGWMGFVCVSALVTTIINFIFEFVGLMQRYEMIVVRLAMLDLITIICSSVNYWEGAQSYCEFVCIAAFVLTLLLLVVHVLGLIRQFPGPWLLIEFIYYCVFSVFYLIAAIVAASSAKYHSSIAACTFFAFAATAVYAVDTFFQYRAWRSGQAEMATRATTTTTTTTTTHQRTVETGETYGGETY